MSDQKELKDFMKKKNAEARGELDLESEESEDGLTDAPKSVNKDAAMENLRAAKAMVIIRMILNMVLIIPIVLSAIFVIGYILIKFLPSILSFIKNFLFMIMKNG